MASYTKTTWVNGSTPAINALNLNNIEDGIAGNSTDIGTLTSLTTTAKSNLVLSINEINAKSTDLVSDTSPQLGANLDTNSKMIYHQMVSHGSISSTENINWQVGAYQKLSTGGSFSLTFSDPTATAPLFLEVTYGGVHTVTFPTNVQWSGGTTPTLTKVTGKIDLFTFVFNGTYYWGTYSLNHDTA